MKSILHLFMISAAYLSLMFSPVCSAQDFEENERLPGYWLQDSPLHNFSNFRQPLSPGEYAAVSELVKNISSIFRASKALNPPTGIAVEVVPSFADNFWREEVPFWPEPLRIHVVFYRLFKDCPTCPINKADQDSGGFYLEINSPFVLMEASQVNEQKLPMFARMHNLFRSVGAAHGFPAYENEWMLLTKSNTPIWLPVSRGEYMRRLLKQERARLKENENLLGEPSVTQTDRHLSEMEKDLKELEKIDPATARQLRENMRKSGSQIAAQSGEDQLQRQEGLKRNREHVSSLENELAAMSPKTLKSQACVAANPLPSMEEGIVSSQGAWGGKNSSMLVSDEPIGQRVVIANKNYFTRKPQADTIKFMAVRSYQGGDLTSSEVNDPFIFRLRKQVADSLDWQALFRLVSP